MDNRAGLIEQPKSSWPLWPTALEAKGPNEMIETVTTLTATVSTSARVPWEHFGVFSKWVKSVAICFRFGQRQTGLLQVGERMKATVE